MNCEAYEALLMQLVEGNLPPEDEARLREHEAVCPACAQRRADMEALLADLSDLKEEELPLPADFHQGWTRLVEEEANVMQKEKATGKKKSSWRRILSVAAAAVVLVGGTLLTRDQLSGVTTPQTAAQSKQRSVESYDYAGDVSPYAYTNEEAAYDSGANGVGLMMPAESGAGDAAVDTTKIIRTASLTLGTQDFEQDLEQLQAYCKDSGGWVSYVSQSGDADKANRRASLTLRIPVEKLDELLAGAEGYGRVINRTETAEDVTESYQDTAARLATQQAKMERLQALMNDTASLSDLLELESAIADTQYTIDSLQSRLNSTDSQVNYATVDVSLREESAAEAVTTREKSLGERVLAGLQTGWETFAGFMKDMVVFLSAALPYLAAVAILTIMVRLICRKKRSDKQ